MDSSIGVQASRKTISDLMMAYVLEYHREDLLKILEQPDPDVHYSLTCHMLILMNDCPKVHTEIFRNPDWCFSICDSAIVRAAKKLYESCDEKERASLIPKKHLHLRVISMADWAEVSRSTIPCTQDYGKFLSVRGTVIRSTLARILEYKREYRCAKCAYEFTVDADYDQNYAIQLPPQCPNPDKPCKSTSMQPVDAAGCPTHCKDYQEIKLQEGAHSLALGIVPRSMWVTLEDDLVDSCKPGDDVTVCGQVRRRWQPYIKDERIKLELVLKANSLTVNNEVRVHSAVDEEMADEFRCFWARYASQPLLGRNVLLQSFCPELYGLFVVKLSAAVVLAGGISRVDVSGTKVRGESHLLMVGDPGAGKSQILKYVCQLSPRSVLTTGIGTTSAGLTVSAVRDSGDWHLEAGALVLADGGVCCIDEFSQIREHDRVSIHEAMEQQTISVAKAGLVCKLNTRCTIFAATNPKGGSYDDSVNLSINAGLASPLLSRFDLILVLRDTKDAAWDDIVARHILNDNFQCQAFKVADRDAIQEFWTFKRLRSYFSHIKQLKPMLTEPANRVLSQYYHKQRQANDRNAARTTVRMLESMIRLAQGHARLMYRTEVTLEDAVAVITLMESSMQSAALISSDNALHSSFPDDPMMEYRHQAQLVLTCLGLNSMILDIEKSLEASENYYRSQGKLGSVDGEDVLPKKGRMRSSDPDLIAQTQRVIENIRHFNERFEEDDSDDPQTARSGSKKSTKTGGRKRKPDETEVENGKKKKWDLSGSDDDIFGENLQLGKKSAMTKDQRNILAMFANTEDDMFYGESPQQMKIDETSKETDPSEPSTENVKESKVVPEGCRNIFGMLSNTENDERAAEPEAPHKTSLVDTSPEAEKSAFLSLFERRDEDDERAADDFYSTPILSSTRIQPLPKAESVPRSSNFFCDEEDDGDDGTFDL